MPGTPTKPEFSVEWDGRTVYFCCDRCVKRFLENPEYYIAHVDYSQSGFAMEGAAGAAPFRLSRFLGQFHPMAVHFPIAFAWGALIAELMALLAGVESWRVITRFLLHLAALSAVVAAALGLAFASGVDFGDDLACTAQNHKALGLMGGVFLILAALTREWSERRDSRLFRALSAFLLLLAVAAVSAAAWYGGELAHGVGHITF
jgi:uncharacterized membrane protein/YHS domain-containing protein